MGSSLERLKILVAPGDFAGCGYYRMIVPFGYLKRQGYDITFIDERTDRRLRTCDILVIERQYDTSLIPMLRAVQARGGRVLYEIDDSYHTIPRSNPNFATFSTGREATNGAETIMAMCDGIIVSTPYLADAYAKYNKNVHVCYNSIDDRQIGLLGLDNCVYTGALKRPGEIRIGWGGSNTHVEDLRTAMPGLIRAMRGDARIKFVCLGHDVRNLLPSDVRARAEYAGKTYADRRFTCASVDSQELPSVRYYGLLKSADLDIAIAPICHTSFNSAKSYLKVMEYAMLGIPSVASNHTPYRQWHQENPQTCDLATSLDKPKKMEHDWYCGLMAFVISEVRRREFGQNGMRAVQEHHLISQTAWRWEGAIKSVAAPRQVGT